VKLRGGTVEHGVRVWWRLGMDRTELAAASMGGRCKITYRGVTVGVGIEALAFLISGGVCYKSASAAQI